MAARDIIQAAAGAAGATEANYIEDVFSTYLYTGNGSTQTITNGIDLSTKGGMVWTKTRNAAYSNILVDSVRGVSNLLYSDTTGAQSASSDITSFSTTGYALQHNFGGFNRSASGEIYASWTFRKQPKFFDVVTYTGNGDSGRQIAHNLGCVPGMVIIKKTSSTGPWAVWHKGSSISSSIFGLSLNATSAAYLTTDATGQFTSTVFTPYYVQDAGATSPSNQSGQTYVAYLFADSNSGGFGPAGTDSVVACGSYSGTGAAGNNVSIGWEPQWVLIKRSNAGANGWSIADNMRGLTASGSNNVLFPHLSNAEVSGITGIAPTATGFSVNSTDSDYNQSGSTYIYLAIRRGPMKTPTDATKVFAPVAYTGNSSNSRVITAAFSPDFLLNLNRTSSLGHTTANRLTGSACMKTSYTDAEDPTRFAYASNFANQNGIGVGNYGEWNTSAQDYCLNFFRRAPGFFDVVNYLSPGTNGQVVAHNLGVVPEMVIIKDRSPSSYRGWLVNISSQGFDKYLVLNDTAAIRSGIDMLSAASTSTQVTIGNGSDVAYTGRNFIMYLFATCPGVSKVFSFTGNGSSQTINCGFTSGARFVLIKRTDSTGDWYVWDTARGIVSANDPHLSLNTDAAEVTTDDTIDPASSGFIVNQVAATNVNVNNATYIGLAIA